MQAGPCPHLENLLDALLHALLGHLKGHVLDAGGRLEVSLAEHEVEGEVRLDVGQRRLLTPDGVLVRGEDHRLGRRRQPGGLHHALGAGDEAVEHLRVQ